MNGSPRRWLLLALLAVGLLLFLQQTAEQEPVQDKTAGATTPAAADPSASAPANPFWDLAAQASARADTSEASASIDLLGWERDWCRAQSLRAQALTPEQLQALMDSEPIRGVANAIGAQVRLRLKGLRTPRADAVFDALQAQDKALDAMARLRERARHTDDAFVIALALQSACTDAACQRDLSRRWQRLEPHNLHAYLWEFRSDEMSTLPAVLAGIAQASSSKSYHYEFMDILRDAGATPSQGPLALMIETEVITRVGGRNSLQLHSLVSACQEAGPASGISLQCGAAAEKIWALNDEMLLLAMVSAVMAQSQAEPPPHWQDRKRLIDAATQLLREARHALTAEAQARRLDAAMRCRPLEPGLHQQIWLEPEWRFLKRTVQQKESTAIASRPDSGDAPTRAEP